MSTFTGQVSASGRDAQQAAVGNAAVINDTSLQTAGRAYWGIAFTNVTIPQGSFIGRAVIETYGLTKYPYMVTQIYGEAANNATVYAATSNNLSNRTRTTANVSHTTTYSVDGWQSTPDLRAVVQEIVNRASFASGNALSTIWLNTTSGVGATATAYDLGNSNAPKITIDYYSGQGAAVTGLATTATPGTPTITTTLTVSVFAVASTTTIGTPTITTTVTTTVAAIDVPTGIGSPTVSVIAPSTALVDAIVVATQFGTPVVEAGPIVATVDGLPISVALGTLTLTGSRTVSVQAISVATSVGHARVRDDAHLRNIATTGAPVRGRWDAQIVTRRYDTDKPVGRWIATRTQ